MTEAEIITKAREVLDKGLKDYYARNPEGYSESIEEARLLLEGTSYALGWGLGAKVLIIKLMKR